MNARTTILDLRAAPERASVSSSDRPGAVRICMKPTRVSFRRSFRFWPLAALCAFGVSAAPAWADEPSPTELAIARRLFKEATELELEREWQPAAAKLREAIQVKDTPGLRFHLAHCEEQLGMLVEAMLDYERAADLIASGTKAPDVEALLGPARRALEQRLPSLLIVIPAGVPNLSVELNGKPLARSILGRPAPVNPGKYAVVVSAPDHSRFVTEVQIAEGERKRIQAELTPIAPSIAGAVPPPQPERPRESSDRGALTYVIVGESAFTLAALGVGVGYLLVKGSAEDRALRAKQTTHELGGEDTSLCSRPDLQPALERSCAESQEAVDDYNRARFLSIAGFVGAGIGAASVALTVALWPDRRPPAVSASVRPGGMFLSVAGVY
jgi:tetratricopeptide (TPR) repeat protein